MTQQLKLENARIIWPNFAGKKKEFNAEGDRNFNVYIDDPALADELAKEGWNVKMKEGYEDGDPPFWILKVKVNYDSKRPPRIYKINADGSNKVLLDEGTVMLLDLLRIERADILVNASAWTSKSLGMSGITPYVDTMYVVTEVNPLDEKWDSIADSPLGD